MSAPHAVTLRWRTDVAEQGRLSWGNAPGSLSGVLDEVGSRTEHELRLSGLDPDSTYYYSVGSSVPALAGDDSLHFFRTHPLSGTAGAYRIWVIGDAGTGTASQIAVRDSFFALTSSSGIAPRLWLQLGDNAYNSGSDAEYQVKNFDIYQALFRSSPSFPCFGNHEGVGTGYFGSFTLPTAGESGGLASGTEAYYSHDLGNIHFVALDSYNSSRAANGAQAQWLEADLQANTLPWVIAYWHHPPYSKGTHDSDTEIELVEMRSNIVPILEAHGVDLVLCGHSHNYERSRFMDAHEGVSSTFNAALKSLGGMVAQAGFGRIGSDGPYLKRPGPHGGTVYAVAGTAGQVGGGSLDHPAHLVNLSVLGSMVLDINGNSLNAVMLDSSGSTRDSFALLKADLTPFPSSTPTMLPTSAPAGADMWLAPQPLSRGQTAGFGLAGGLKLKGWKLFNASGARVGAGDQGRLQSSELAAGLYFLVLEATDGSLHRRKLVVVK